MLVVSSLLLFGALAITDPSRSVSREQHFVGPTTVCGEAFALELKVGESATRINPGIDFLTYRVEADDGGFVLYEGNAPQPADDQIETGRSWPSVVAIHDNRIESVRAGASIRDRLRLGDERAALCR